MLSPTHGRADAGVVAEALGQELGWGEEERELQLADFEAELVAEGL